MTPEETIRELQAELKRERIEKKLYKKQVAQYQRDLIHRDTIIERLRTALSKRQKRDVIHQPQPSNNETTIDDREWTHARSSRTSIDLPSEDNEYDQDQEETLPQELYNQRVSSPEYGHHPQSTLSDLTTDVLSSTNPVTPRSRAAQSSQVQATVKTPRRPRVTGVSESVFSCYVEHSSPTLRAYNRKHLVDDESLDLQQVQTLALAEQLKKAKPPVGLFENAEQSGTKEILEFEEDYFEVDGEDFSNGDQAYSQQPLTTLSTTNSFERSTNLGNLSANGKGIHQYPSNIAPGTHQYVAEDENLIPYDTRVPNSPPTLQHEFAYVDVVRKKYERTKLHGRTCTCCSEFYRAVGTLPDADEPSRMQPVSERIGKNSRHREVYKRPRTPPGFWEVEFPSSQELKRMKEEPVPKDSWE